MTDQNVSIQTHHRMREKATLELKRFLEITLYLWVVFGLMSIHKSVILSRNIWTTQSRPLQLSMR